MKTTAIYSIFLLLLLSGCGKSDNRLYLESINAIAETDGRQALAMLDSVEDLDYSKKERAYFNLLTIKSRDKAYIEHKNDSLIKEVLEYYEKNEGEDYAEALYYGGRVYSDLGNYPISLEYYQRALNELPNDKIDHRLRGQVVSQLGRLLNELRLYSQAIPYLEESIEYDKQDCDSFSLAFDYGLIRAAYLGIKDYNMAEESAKSAIAVSTNLPNEDIVYFKSCLAEVKLHREDNDSALILIRDMVDTIPGESEPYIWADASQIYYKSGIYDTAYIYAKKMVRDSRAECKHIAYYILLKPEIKKLMPIDTILFYYKDYESYINDYLNRHDSEQALMQTSMYNYELHVRESREAMNSRDKMMKLVLVSLIVILVLVLIVVNMKLREKSRVIQLNESKAQIADLQSKIEGLTNYINESSGAEYIRVHHEEFEISIKEMRSKFISLIDDKALVDSMSDFKSTESYKKLIDKVEHNNVIEQGDWSILENEVQAKSPRFIKNLHFLSRGKLNESEIKTCILIKIGMTPTQLARLLNLEKGTISSRREGIGVKIIGEKTPVSKVDRFIRLL